MFGGQQRIDVRRTHDRSIIHKGLMVALDLFDVVEVVHHDAERFLNTARRDVSEPVDPSFRDAPLGAGPESIPNLIPLY